MAQLYKSFRMESPQGEVFTSIISKCLVTNAHDPFIQEKPSAQSQVKGLWDTGASGTVITQNVVDALNLVPIGQRRVFHAGGEDIVNAYIINLILPNGVGAKFLQVTLGVLSGFDVLIGMDVIGIGEFTLLHQDGKHVFEFKIPVNNNNTVNNKPSNLKQPRNDLCLCGSGKKYKNCHGAGQ